MSGFPKPESSVFPGADVFNFKGVTDKYFALGSHCLEVMRDGS